MDSFKRVTNKEGCYVCEVNDQDNSHHNTVGISWDHNSKNATIYDGSNDMILELSETNLGICCGNNIKFASFGQIGKLEHKTKPTRKKRKTMSTLMMNIVGK